jgi:copper transport protein
MSRARLGVACALLLVPAQAWAHAHLLRSFPARGDTLRVAPRFLRLEFSEAPELSMSRLRLMDALDREIRLLPLHAAGDSTRVLVADIAGHLAPGRYTVSWQVAGRDGHPVRGELAFVVAEEPAAALVPPHPVSPPPPAARTSERHPLPSETHRENGFDSESLPYVLFRWAQFIGLFVVVGAAGFRWLVLERVAGAGVEAGTIDDAAERTRRVAWIGAILLACSAAARLFAQWRALRVDAGDEMSLGRVLTLSLWGHAWLAQVAGIVVLAIGLVLARDVKRATGWIVAAFAVLVLAATPGFSGHAAVSAMVAPVLIDWVHVLAAGGWLGTLLVLLAAGLPATSRLSGVSRATAMSTMVNAFSSAALVCATLVVVTGVLASIRTVGSLSALMHSAYGNMLLRKLFFLAVAAAIGLYNWRRARPALASSGDETAIRRAMMAELAAGAVILLVTAYLVATPTPAELIRP